MIVPNLPRRTVVVVLAALLSACVTDRNAAPDTSCGDVAVLAEAFPLGHPHPSGTSALTEPLGSLVEGLAAEGEAEVRAAAEVLLAAEARVSADGVPGDGETDLAAGPAGRVLGDAEWAGAFGDVDDWAIGSCGFSMRTLVMEGVSADHEPLPEARGPRSQPSTLAGILDWADVLERVRDQGPDAGWTEDGYLGAVGIDPGVTVVVDGVADQSTAMEVCRDVGNVVEADAAGQGVQVVVLSPGGLILAQSDVGRDCTATELPDDPARARS